MALQFDADADALIRTTNLPAGDYTICGFLYLSVDRGTYSCLLALDNGTGDWQYLETDADGTTLYVWDESGPGALVLALSIETWYFVAFTLSGTTLTGYARALTNPTLSSGNKTGVSVARGNLRFGRSPYTDEFLNGRLAGVRVWNAALSEAQLLAESQQLAPVRTADLNAYYPMWTEANGHLDYSGNGYDMTAGTATTADGPPVPEYLGGVDPGVIQPTVRL